MREPLQQFQGDTYERPNQPWLCGLLETGEACPMGPGKGGRCPRATACHPIREGDRWHCNRSPARGGVCEEGPTPEGQCRHLYQCTPVRSLRASRGRFVVGCFVAVLGGLCLMLSSAERNEFLAPGKLSVHHAQLLERGDATNRCASCHAAGSQGFIDWIDHFINNDSNQPSQTSLCLECHAKQLSAEWATAAHNVDPHRLVEDQDNHGRLRNPREALACALCHQEHHGPNHDLALMSDKACQACHQERYNRFADDHPEFDRWPVTRRTRIAFDHASHQLKHFPKENQSYACAKCHRQDASGDFQQTLGYETACAQCHDRKIEESWDTGVALFTLPMLDVEALRTSGHEIGQWPEQAQGEFDGALSAVVKLLLMADARGAKALGVLKADFDFFDVDPDDPEQLQAAADVVWAAKRLMHDVTTRGHEALRERAEIVLQRKLSMSELVNLTSRLSPENLSAITERWLPNLPTEFGSADNQPIVPALPEQDLQEARSRIACGGWLRDDVTLSIRYVPCGHADPWITAWIDVLAEAASGKQAALAEPLLRQTMAPEAAGQCGSCHSVDRTADDRLQVQWFAKRPADATSPFTKFSHGPHLIQSQLADCTACHRTNLNADVMASYTDQSPHAFEPGFELLTKASCAECHVSDAAGDSCLQCHQYHAKRVD
ncbi:MAG: hypothetical protein MI725_00605 [Pirellulales bacterium]|nr:hypothetical protein [Pirellulales bacterium]